MAKKGEVKELVGILEGMREYLYNTDNNYHIHMGFVYCRSCRAISAFGENHNVYLGADCGGDSYGTEKHTQHCIRCYTPNFIKLSLCDIRKLNEAYKSKTPEVLIDGINNGLQEMHFPDLYNEKLPKLIRSWKRVSKIDKVKQVNRLLIIGSKINAAKELADNLEKMVYGEKEDNEEDA
jgi:hypothetical protein